MSELIRCDRCKKETIELEKISEVIDINESFVFQASKRPEIFPRIRVDWNLCNECYIKFLEGE